MKGLNSMRTLKITQNEYNIIHRYVTSDKCFMGITLPDDEFGCFVTVHNTSEFRKSLIDEISLLSKKILNEPSRDIFTHLKSILYKLEKIAFEDLEFELDKVKGYTTDMLQNFLDEIEQYWVKTNKLHSMTDLLEINRELTLRETS